MGDKNQLKRIRRGHRPKTKLVNRLLIAYGLVYLFTLICDFIKELIQKTRRAQDVNLSLEVSLSRFKINNSI